MLLKGKKVAILGDSITEGVGASSLDTRYTNVFARLAECEVCNYGISGSRIARQKLFNPNDRHEQHFLSRVEDMISDADAVIVFGGTNDFGHGDADLGSFNDTSEYTFYGAMHSLCKKLLVKYPDSLIVFMTPLHRITEKNTVNEKGLACHPLIDYVNAIRQVTEYYSIPVLDLYANSGLQPEVQIIKEKYMPDGLHPSDLGARRIAERLYTFISTL